jgi:hypothetical protein
MMQLVQIAGKIVGVSKPLFTVALTVLFGKTTNRPLYEATSDRRSIRVDFRCK